MSLKGGSFGRNCPRRIAERRLHNGGIVSLRSLPLTVIALYVASPLTSNRFALAQSIAAEHDAALDRPHELANEATGVRIGQPRPVHVLDPKFTSRRIQVQFQTGVGTSVGEAGVIAEYNLHDRLALGGGVGTNIVGVEVSAHARARPLIGTTDSGRLHALTLQSALALGQYKKLGDVVWSQCDEPRYCPLGPSPEWVAWLQFELGWETRASNGFLFRVSAGYAFAINSPNWRCTIEGKASPCRDVYTSFPTLALALGSAF